MLIWNHLKKQIKKKIWGLQKVNLEVKRLKIITDS